MSLPDAAAHDFAGGAPMTTGTSAGSHYLTADQIAAELGVHVQTVQSYFRTGGLPGRKIGHSWRTTRAAFDQWLTSGPVPADGPHDDDGPHLEDRIPPGQPMPPLETKG